MKVWDRIESGIRKRLVAWLLKDLDMLKIGNNTVTITGTSIDMGGGRITNVGTPQASGDAVPYPITDSTVAGISASKITSGRLVVDRLPLSEAARYMTVSSIISGLSSMAANDAQSVLYQLVDQATFEYLNVGIYNLLIDILTYNASDETISSSKSTNAGVYYRKNLTINSGVTLTANTGPGVIIANTLTNNGAIVSGWVKASGGSGGGGNTNRGGNGRGGLIILTKNITIGSIRANGENGLTGTTGYTGAGGNGSVGRFWIVSGHSIPSGGNGGRCGSGYPNGGGGGASPIEYCGGNGGSASVTTFNNAKDLLSDILKCACDWWLVNVLGKTPSSVKSFPYLGGSGGGGGGSVAGNWGGGGGGGAGQIIVFGLNVTAGTLEAKGGNGARDYYSYGGGGGGGGLIYIFCRSLSGTNTFNVSGGAGGTGYHGNGTDGGAGSGHVIYI